MPETDAKYLCPIGRDRIVSFVSNNGAPIPEIMEQTYYNEAQNSGGARKGNRKISVLVEIFPDIPRQDTDDTILKMTVRVPAGIISPHVQRFTANTPRLYYYPQVIVSPYSEIFHTEAVWAEVGDLSSVPPVFNEDPDEQTVEVWLHQSLPKPLVLPLRYLAQVDWSHSVIN
jgi:hypothetical protein